MAHVTFPKPVKAAKKPNRTVSKARAAKRRKSEAVKRDVYRVVDLRDSFYCRACGKPGHEHHHIVYRSQGGPHTTANIVTLCRRCHEETHMRLLFIHGSADDILTITERDDELPQETPCQ